MNQTNLDRPDCFVCQKHRGVLDVPGGPIYQDELVYAGHAQIPPGQETAYLGYLMVEPKRHVPGLADLLGREAAALGILLARLSRALQASVGAEHVYAFVLGDHVPHLHVHLVPRYPGAPTQYWGIHVDEWPGAPRGGPAEIEALVRRLRDCLQAG
jgi:histidine triad (HIT) family protein